MIRDHALDDEDPRVVASRLGAPTKDGRSALVWPTVEDLREDVNLTSGERVTEDVSRDDLQTLHRLHLCDYVG